jgi:energy-coupling factor transporter ATP-binding protein EcfA2
VADRLVVRGAREHNLRGVDLDLPRDSLVVFTGLSGSGKSSLAFDTIFAEGQRRYVESLSAYARQFLGQMDKPDVDFIEGLSPAVSIDQKSTNRNPRSTVGTITEVYDYLRLLYARAGVPHCPVCGHVIEKQTPQQIVDQVLAMEEGSRFQVLAPVVRTRKGEFVDLFSNLQAQGYSRVMVDGTVHQLTDPPKLKKQEKHDIAVVVDRLTVKGSAKQRLTDSVETALRLADGPVVLDFVDLPDAAPHRERRFSERMACPNGHPLSLDDLEPRTFSFNSPYGACPECNGLGTRQEIDPSLVIPDSSLSIAEGGLAPPPTEFPGRPVCQLRLCQPGPLAGLPHQIIAHPGHRFSITNSLSCGPGEAVGPEELWAWRGGCHAGNQTSRPGARSFRRRLPPGRTCDGGRGRWGLCEHGPVSVQRRADHRDGGDACRSDLYQQPEPGHHLCPDRTVHSSWADQRVRGTRREQPTQVRGG